MKKIITLLSALALTAVLVCTPVFAEGENYVTNQTWQKFLLAGNLTKLTEDGQDYYHAEGINAAYNTPGIDILPALKAALGDESDADIELKLDVRIIFNGDQTETTTGVCVRAKQKDGVKEADFVADFKDNYEGAFIKNTSGTNLIGRLATDEEVGSEWKTLTFNFSIEESDFTFDGFGSWMLCLDRLVAADSGSDSYEKGVKAVDLRNVVVTIGGAQEEEPDDEEPTGGENEGTVSTAPTPIPTAKNDTPTPTPVTINTPYNFNKYPQTLVNGKVYGEEDTVNGTEATPTSNAGGTVGTEENGSNGWVLYAVIGGIVVIVAAAVVTVIVLKKKKSVGGEEQK